MRRGGLVVAAVVVGVAGVGGLSCGRQFDPATTPDTDASASIPDAGAMPDAQALVHDGAPDAAPDAQLPCTWDPGATRPTTASSET